MARCSSASSSTNRPVKHSNRESHRISEVGAGLAGGSSRSAKLIPLRVAPAHRHSAQFGVGSRTARGLLCNSLSNLPLCRRTSCPVRQRAAHPYRSHMSLCGAAVHSQCEGAVACIVCSNPFSVGFSSSD
jgi:hypothetical protein